MGSSTIASGLHSTAIGSNAEAAGDYSTAIGRYVKVRAAATGTIFIGDNSVTSMNNANHSIIDFLQDLMVVIDFLLISDLSSRSSDE